MKILIIHSGKFKGSVKTTVNRSQLIKKGYLSLESLHMMKMNLIFNQKKRRHPVDTSLKPFSQPRLRFINALFFHKKGESKTNGRVY